MLRWSRYGEHGWGSGPRGAPPLGWYHQQVTLYNTCSLGTLLKQPRPASAALITPRHALHPNKRSAWHGGGAWAGLAQIGATVISQLVGSAGAQVTGAASAMDQTCMAADGARQARRCSSAVVGTEAALLDGSCNLLSALKARNESPSMLSSNKDCEGETAIVGQECPGLRAFKVQGVQNPLPANGLWYRYQNKEVVRVLRKAEDHGVPSSGMLSPPSRRRACSTSAMLCERGNQDGGQSICCVGGNNFTRRHH